MRITTFFSLAAFFATNLNAQIDTAATVNRGAMTRAELLRQSASALTALQQSRSEQVRAAVESARLTRQQFELNQTSSEALLTALRRASEIDSLTVARATALFAQRAITRQHFDNEVGLLRADQIVRATQDTSRSEAARRESLFEAQWRLQRELRWTADSARASAEQAMFERRLVDSIAQRVQRDTARSLVLDFEVQRAMFERTSEQRAADAMRAAMRLSDLEMVLDAAIRNRLELPTTSLGMGLLCSGSCTSTVGGRSNVFTFTGYPVVGAVEPGSIAARLGLQRGDTLKAIDDISVATRQGGERLSALTPNRTVKLGWSRNGVAHTASVTLPPATMRDALTAARLRQSVGNTMVEVFGSGASWTRDPQTGALRITGDSITVIVRPPPQ